MRIIYGLMSASVISLDGVPHILSVTRDIQGHYGTQAHGGGAAGK